MAKIPEEYLKMTREELDAEILRLEKNAAERKITEKADEKPPVTLRMHF